MIRSGSVKSSYQEILNCHSNLHVGFVQGLVVVVFFFGLGGFYGGEGGAALVKIAQNVNAYKICF